MRPATERGSAGVPMRAGVPPAARVAALCASATLRFPPGRPSDSNPGIDFAYSAPLSMVVPMRVAGPTGLTKLAATSPIASIALSVRG